MRRLLLALMLCPGLCFGQSPSQGGPAWVIEQYFFAPAWPAKAEYYTGEMKARYSAEGSIGEAGVPALRTSIRPVETSPSGAVYAVQIAAEGRVQDVYAYLVKEDTVWRLSAIRGLWLPALFYMLLDTLASTPTLPDSDAAQLPNMRLIVSTDSALKAFFHAHQPVLDSIAETFGRDTARRIVASRASLASGWPRSAATQLAELHFDGARRDAGAPGCLLLRIGGMLDNEVGFMRCPPGTTPPSISVESFILVEGVATGWYLYKTT